MTKELNEKITEELNKINHDLKDINEDDKKLDLLLKKYAVVKKDLLTDRTADKDYLIALKRVIGDLIVYIVARQKGYKLSFQ